MLRLWASIPSHIAGPQPAIHITTIQIIRIIRRTVSFLPVQLDWLEAHHLINAIDI